MLSKHEMINLSWKWLVMMPQNALVVKIAKKYDAENFFHFFGSGSHDKVPCTPTCDCWSCLFRFLFLWYFKLTNSNKNLLHLWKGGSIKTPSWQQWQWTQLSIAATISSATRHPGCHYCTDGCSYPKTLSACLLVATGREAAA